MSDANGSWEILAARNIYAFWHNEGMRRRDNYAASIICRGFEGALRPPMRSARGGARSHARRNLRTIERRRGGAARLLKQRTQEKRNTNHNDRTTPVEHLAP